MRSEFFIAVFCVFLLFLLRFFVFFGTGLVSIDLLSLSFCLVIGLAFSFVIKHDFALGLFFDLFIDFWGSKFRLITFEVADLV